MVILGWMSWREGAKHRQLLAKFSEARRYAVLAGFLCLRVAQNLFIAERNLLVEGPSELVRTIR